VEYPQFQVAADTLASCGNLHWHQLKYNVLEQVLEVWNGSKY
jgi:hypothetical protein